MRHLSLAVASFTVPADPALVGFVLHWQALLGTPLAFSNREVTAFSDL